MRKRYIATILTALVVVAYMTFDDHSRSVDIVSESLEYQEPDYMIQDLDLQSFNKQGLLVQQISAISATHFPKNDTTLLAKPNIIIHENSLPKWGIQSGSGRLLKDKAIHLEEDVLIVPMQSNGNDFSLTTNSLFIDLEKQIADTDDSVSIESDTSELTAKGMIVYLDTQKVEFKSQVRGRHVPETH